MYGISDLLAMPSQEEDVSDDEAMPRYKVAIYESVGGDWVPKSVLFFGGEEPMEHEDDSDESEHDGMGEHMSKVDPLMREEMFSSPLYGRAVMMASARKEAQARRASMTYQSIVPLFNDESDDSKTAALRFGRTLSPAELAQRKLAAKASAEARKKMGSSNMQTLEQRRTELRQVEQNLKQQRKKARGVLRQQRRSGKHWKKLGKSALHAAGHEFVTAGKLITGEQQVTPFVPRRASISADRMERINELAGRS